MAKLPSALDLARKPTPTSSPGIAVDRIDYAPMAKGAEAMAQGIARAGAGVAAIATEGEKAQAFEIDRRLLDFKLQTEMDLEAHRRNMPVGGEGYVPSWSETFQARAREFVGEGDANIPQALRGQIGTRLKQHEVMLQERAQRDAWAEQDRAVKAGLEETLGRTRSMVEANPDRLEEMHAEGARLIEGAQLPPAMKSAFGKKYRETMEESAAAALADSVTDADSYERARERLAPHRAERVTAKGVAQGIRNAGAFNEIDRTSERLASGEAIEPKAIVFHYTGGTTANGAVDTLRKRGLAYNYIVDKDGSVHVLAPGGTRAAHMRDSDKGPGGFGNGNSIGIAYVGRGEDDITDAQRSVGRALAARDAGKFKIAPTQVFGHGELNSHKEGREGATDAKWIRENGFDAPAPGREVDPAKRPMAERSFVAMAGHNVARETPAGEVPVGTTDAEAYDGPFSNLSLAKRRAIWSRAEAKLEKIKAGVDTVIREQMKVAGSGYLPPDEMLATLGEQVKALKDPVLAARYDTMMRQAAWTGRMQKAPPAALDDQVRQLENQAQEIGATKETLDTLEHARTTAASVRKEVNDDPMTRAHKAGISAPFADGPPADLDPGMRGRWQMPIAPIQLDRIDWSSPQLGQTLGHRMEQAKAVGRYYEQPPQVFTKSERDWLKDALRRGGDEMLRVMGSIVETSRRSGIDSALVLREISKDAPELSIVGGLVADGGDRRLLETAAKAFQFKASQGDKFVSNIPRKDVLPDLGEYADVLATTPTKVDAVRQTADLIYEYEHRQKGLKEFDQSHYRDVVARVMGETKDASGASYGGVGRQGAGWYDGKWASGWSGTPKVLVPAEVRTDGFDRMVDVLRLSDIADPPRSASGTPLAISDIKQATWISVEPGRYALQLRTDPDGTRVVALDAGQRPYVLDMRPILPEIRKRAPEIFRGWDGVQRGAKAMPARADEQGQEKQGVGWYERLTAPVTKDDAPAKRWLESTPGAKGLGAIIRRELGGP